MHDTPLPALAHVVSGSLMCNGQLSCVWSPQIDKSHPIHVRNDNNKKRKKVCVALLGSGCCSVDIHVTPCAGKAVLALGRCSQLPV